MKDKMKNTFFLTLIVLAALPAAAKKKATPNCFANGDGGSSVGQDYAARVDGLLRDAHASLRSISERVEAGSMSPDRAKELKLAVTLDTISRLDTLSAVYDVRLHKNGVIHNKTQAASNDCVADKLDHTHSGNGTISVKELKSEHEVYEDLPFAELRDHFDAIESSGYSVSLFTDWQKQRVNGIRRILQTV
ncbi:MAG: hypothetical protein WA213_08190 [Terriglobales bacterium]